MQDKIIQTQENWKQFINNFQDIPIQLIPILKLLLTSQDTVFNLEQFLTQKLCFVDDDEYCCSRLNKDKDGILNGYKCYDCILHKTSILCKQCFEYGDHIGHRYNKISINGYCDCGNQKMIKNSQCSLHRSSINNPSQQKLNLYKQYIKLLFIWIIKLFNSKIQKYLNYGQILLIQIIKYLRKFTTKNKCFKNINYHIFYDNNQVYLQYNNLAYNLIYIQSIYKNYKFSIYQILSIVFSQQYKKQLFYLYLKAFNQIQYFQQTYLFQHWKYLASQSQTIKNVCQLYSQELKINISHSKQLNYTSIYSKILEILQEMNLQSGKIFINILIKKSIFYAPFLSKDYTCQSISQEYENSKSYLQIMIKIIRYSNKIELQLMLISYYNLFKQKLKQTSQQTQSSYFITKNYHLPLLGKIIFLIIFKYFNCNINKIDLNIINNIINNNFDINLLFYVIFNIIVKNCQYFTNKKLQQNDVSFNWKKLKYFQNQNIYLQLLCLKIMNSIMSRFQKQQLLFKSFYNLLAENQDYDTLSSYYQINQEMCQAAFVVNMKLFERRINIILILYQLQFSCIPEIYAAYKLQQYQLVQQYSQQFIQSLFGSIQQISKQNLQYVDTLIFNQKLDYKLIEKYSSENTIKKIYYPKNIKIYRLNINLLYSFYQTKLNKIINININNKFNQIQLNKQKLQYFLSQSILFTFSNLFDQLDIFIQNQDIQYEKLIKLNYHLKLFYKSNNIYQQIQNLAKKYLQKKCKKIYNSQNIEQHYPQYQQYLFNNQSNQQNNQLILKQKRKQLQKKKKQALLKSKKIIQNQKIYQDNNIQKNKDSICLICRDCNKEQDFCYLGKLNFTSHMFHRFGLFGQNFILKTCMHLVHYDCFLNINKKDQCFACPLCRQSCNIVFPSSNLNQVLIKKITILYEYIMSVDNKKLKNIIEQSLLFLSYYILMPIFLNFQLTQRELLMMKGVYYILIFNLTKNYQNNIHSIIQKRNIKNLADIRLLKKFNLLEFSRTIYKYIHKQSQQLSVKQIMLSKFKFTEQAVYKIFKILGKVCDIRIKDQIFDENEIQYGIQDNNSMTIFKPPKNVKDFLLMRDNYLLKSRHKYNRICIICNKLFLFDISNPLKNIICLHQNMKIGYFQSLFIDLSQIKLILFDQTPKFQFNIYKNTNGNYWQFSQNPQGYFFDQENYKLRIKKFILGDEQYDKNKE